MAYKDLTVSEKAVYDWQMGIQGGFKKALFQAMTRADGENLYKLSLGFPEEVAGYRYYTSISGWWNAVRAKAENN